MAQFSDDVENEGPASSGKRAVKLMRGRESVEPVTDIDFLPDLSETQSVTISTRNKKQGRRKLERMWFFHTPPFSLAKNYFDTHLYNSSSL